jgi:hypothetical protein
MKQHPSSWRTVVIILTIALLIVSAVIVGCAVDGLKVDLERGRLGSPRSVNITNGAN